MLLLPHLDGHPMTSMLSWGCPSTSNTKSCHGLGKPYQLQEIAAITAREPGPPT